MSFSVVTPKNSVSLEKPAALTESQKSLSESPRLLPELPEVIPEPEKILPEPSKVCFSNESLEIPDQSFVVVAHIQPNENEERKRSAYKPILIVEDLKESPSLSPIKEINE